MNEEAIQALGVSTGLHSLMLAKIAEKVLTRNERQEVANEWESLMRGIVKDQAEKFEKNQAEDPLRQLFRMTGLDDTDAETIRVAGKKMIDNSRPMVLSILGLDS